MRKILNENVEKELFKTDSWKDVTKYTVRSYFGNFETYRVENTKSGWKFINELRKLKVVFRPRGRNQNRKQYRSEKMITNENLRYGSWRLRSSIPNKFSTHFILFRS